MRTRLAAATAAAGILLAGCSTSSNSDDGTLSGEWRSTLTMMAGTGGVTACQDSASTKCLTAMTNALRTFTAIEKDINQRGASQYPKTVEEIQKYTAAAQDFHDAGCEGNPNGGQILNQCYGDASTVTVCVTNLEDLLRSDESRS